MNWKEFLIDVSTTLFNNDDLLVEFREKRNSNWLGFDGVSEVELEFHEGRLNTILPPSYREFLKASNGFLQLNSLVWNLLPIQDVQWLKQFDESFHNLYEKEFNNFNATDEEYFIYGNDQRTTDFRSEYLIKSLAISGWGDASIILLNPEVKFGDEWEAWMFAVWLLGPARYKSFEDRMKEE